MFLIDSSSDVFHSQVGRPQRGRGILWRLDTGFKRIFPRIRGAREAHPAVRDDVGTPKEPCERWDTAIGVHHGTKPSRRILATGTPANTICANELGRYPPRFLAQGNATKAKFFLVYRKQRLRNGLRRINMI